MNLFYLDDNGVPKPVFTVKEKHKAIKQFSDRNARTVGNEDMNSYGTETVVSTVFLSINHGTSEKPVLWETMIFSSIGDLDGYQRRCAGNKEQAEAMHEVAVQMVEKFFTDNGIVRIS